MAVHIPPPAEPHEFRNGQFCAHCGEQLKRGWFGRAKNVVERCPMGVRKPAHVPRPAPGYRMRCGHDSANYTHRQNVPCAVCEYEMVRAWQKQHMSSDPRGRVVILPKGCTITNLYMTGGEVRMDSADLPTLTNHIKQFTVGHARR